MLCAGLTTHCAADEVSPKYGIHISGKPVAPEDVDTAWELACEAIGASPKLADSAWINVEFQPAVEWDGRLYAGLTTETYVRVRWTGGCTLSGNSALIHELVHVALYLQTGDADSAHFAHDWHKINGLTASCELP